jgi:hypothetical protein
MMSVPFVYVAIPKLLYFHARRSLVTTHFIALVWRPLSTRDAHCVELTSLEQLSPGNLPGTQRHGSWSQRALFENGISIVHPFLSLGAFLLQQEHANAHPQKSNTQAITGLILLKY